MEWIKCISEQPKMNDRIIALFKNGGMKLFKVKTVPLSHTIIAWVRVPDVPKELVRSAAEESFQRVMKSCERFELLNADISPESDFVDDLEFVSKYINNLKRHSY